MAYFSIDQTDGLAAAVAQPACSSATMQNDSTSTTASSFTGSESSLNASMAHGMVKKPPANKRKPLPITPDRTPRRSKPKKEGPHKNSGPKIPTTEELVASGIANAEMMDKESGVLDLADVPDFKPGSENDNWLKYEFDDGFYEDSKHIPSEFEPAESFSNSTTSSADSGVYGKNVTKKGMPLDPNGRFTGRQLVMWHRPRMIEKLILHVQYECHRRGLVIPWDHVVHRLCPGSSGQSAIQHLSKLRDVLVSEGHMVPPLLGKVHVKQPPDVRGFIQNEDGDDMFATRIVRWGEKIEDRKVSLTVPGLIRGSGNYRKDGGAGLSRAIKTKDGSRRNRLPVEIQEVIQERVRRRTRKVKKLSPVSDKSSDSDSDGNYNPSTAAKKRKYGLRKASRKSKCADPDSNQDFFSGDTSSSTDLETPMKKQRKNSVRSSNSESNHLITLKLSPSKLANFPPGISGAGSKSAEDPDIKFENQDSGNERASTYCADTAYQQYLATPDMDIYQDNSFYTMPGASSVAGFAGVVPTAAAPPSNEFYIGGMLINSHSESIAIRDCTINTPQRSATADNFRNMSLSNNGYARDSFQDIFDEGEDTENIPPVASYSTAVGDTDSGETVQRAPHIPIIAQFVTESAMHNCSFNTLSQQDADMGNMVLATTSQQGQQLGYTVNTSLAVQSGPGFDRSFADDILPSELNSADNNMDDVQHDIPLDSIDEHQEIRDESLPHLAMNGNASCSDWENEYYGDVEIDADF